jgi:hypothetical protein
MNTISVTAYLRFAFSVMTLVVFFSLFFSAGFLIIMKIEQGTNAQLGGIGEEMIKNGVRSVSALASVDQAGAAITVMEKHAGGLQQNLDTPKKLQAALGGS